MCNVQCNTGISSKTGWWRNSLFCLIDCGPVKFVANLFMEHHKFVTIGCFPKKTLLSATSEEVRDISKQNDTKYLLKGHKSEWNSIDRNPNGFSKLEQIASITQIQGIKLLKYGNRAWDFYLLFKITNLSQYFSKFLSRSVWKKPDSNRQKQFERCTLFYYVYRVSQY